MLDCVDTGVLVFVSVKVDDAVPVLEEVVVRVPLDVVVELLADEVVVAVVDVSV